MDHATVEISDVEPKAVKVLIETIKVGDKVFGTFGQTSEVTKVRVFKGHTWIYSADLWPLCRANGEPVTIIRATAPGKCAGCGETFKGARGLRSHQASRYLTLACRRPAQ